MHRIGNSRFAPGYTFIELLVASAVGLVVLGGIYQVLLQNQRIYKTQSQMTETQQLVRTGLDVMARDIRQAGNDPCRCASFDTDGLPATVEWGVSVREDYRIRVMMDLPRDANGDGDTWDIVDNDSDGSIDYGVSTVIADDEFGDGNLGSTNPDEDITYFYCAEGVTTPLAGAWGQECIDLKASGASPENRIYRQVRYFDGAGAKLDDWIEPLADYIDQTGPLFEYVCTGGCAVDEKPYQVTIDIRGRTRDTDLQTLQYKYFQLTSDVRLMNIGGQL